MKIKITIMSLLLLMCFTAFAVDYSQYWYAPYRYTNLSVTNRMYIPAKAEFTDSVEFDGVVTFNNSIGFDTLKAYVDTTNLSNTILTGLTLVDSLNASMYVTFDDGIVALDTSTFTTITASEAVNVTKNADITVAGGGNSLFTVGGGGVEMGASPLSFIAGADSSSIKDSTGYGLKLKSDKNIYIKDVLFNDINDLIMPVGAGFSLNGSEKILDMKKIGSYLAIIKFGVIANDTFWVAADTTTF